jgi:hypothetical protein
VIAGISSSSKIETEKLLHLVAGHLAARVVAWQQELLD